MLRSKTRFLFICGLEHKGLFFLKRQFQESTNQHISQMELLESSTLLLMFQGSILVPQKYHKILLEATPTNCNL